MQLAQSPGNATSGSSDVNSLGITYSSTPPRGDLLVIAAIAGSASATMTISGWTTSVSVSPTGAICYLLHRISDGTTASFTIAMGATAQVCACYLDYTAPAGGRIPDVTASGSGTAGGYTSAATGTTGSTNAANELVIAVAGTKNFTTAPTGYSWTNSFTHETSASTSSATTANRVAIAVADKFVTSTGTQASTPSWTNATGTYANVIAAYQDIPTVATTGYTSSWVDATSRTVATAVYPIPPTTGQLWPRTRQYSG